MNRNKRKFSFRKDYIEKTEKKFKEVDVTGEIGKVVDNLSNIISEYIGMRSLAVKGFFWKAIKQWQQDNQWEVKELFDMSTKQRNSELADILLLFEESLKDVLDDPEEKMELKEAILESFEDFKGQSAFLGAKASKKAKTESSDLEKNPLVEKSKKIKEERRKKETSDKIYK